ncbi:MAG: tail fiber domain-containing protein, partial [Flavobacteriales bacterium]|nr:tail fiber domain-containing protein [Flavobacteriales bacterium]
ISRGTGIAPHAFAQLTIDDDADNMINILSPTTGRGFLAFGDAGDAYIGGVVYDHNDNSLDLFANNATRLSITSAGFVGIGTTAPEDMLHISQASAGGLGPVLVIDNSAVSTLSSESQIAFLTDGGASVAGISDVRLRAITRNVGNGAASFQIDTWDGTTEAARLYIKEDGNVGIGTIAPTVKTHIFNTVDGTFTGLAIDNRKTYGAGTGTNEISRIILSLSTALFPDPLTQVMGYISAGTEGESTSFEGFMALGTRTGDTETEKMRITGIGNVGIGTTTPNELLVIGNDVGNLTADKAIVLGSAGNSHMYFAEDASNFAHFWWNGAGNDLHLRVKNVGVEPLAQLVLDAAGGVGIGTATPGGLFELSLDEGRKPASGTWTIVSDERLKNIEGAYTKGLSEILQLEPVTYHYKNVGERVFAEQVLNTQNVGFSAQAIQKVFPEAVGTDPDGYLNFNMHAILVAYVNAIKELKAENETLKSEMAEIKVLTSKVAEIDAMKLELERLKSMIEVEAVK